MGVDTELPPAVVLGILIRLCKYLPDGTAYLMATPTKADNDSFARDVSLYGAAEARERMMGRLASRGAVIHNLSVSR